MNSTILSDLTCLLPLYRSHRFIHIIMDNIDQHLALGAQILISDKHGQDPCVEILDQIYQDNPLVSLHKNTDEGDWIDNINFMIENTGTKYARIIPHDDSASGVSSQKLVASLERNPDAIMASGIVRAFDLDDNPLPNRDELNEDEDKANNQWTIDDILEFTFKGRFAGSFKGVFNCLLVKEHKLYMRRTPTSKDSERLWLNALAMVGRFQFEPDAMFKKRYHADSTSTKWHHTPSDYLDAAKILIDYFIELFPGRESIDKVKFIIYHNTIQKARYLEHKIGKTNYSNVFPTHLNANNYKN